MRAREFIIENGSRKHQEDTGRALRPSYAIPALPNQDPYKQYRFGVAMAAARANVDKKETPQEFAKESAWGENMIVIGYDDITDVIDSALTLVGLSTNEKMPLGTPESEETPETGTTSPVRAFKGYPR